MWLQLALVMIVALVASALAFLARATWLRARGKEPFPKERHITGAGFFICAAAVASLLIGIFVTLVAPETQLGRWMRDDGGMTRYLLICGVWYVVLAGILATLGYSPMRPYK